MPFISIDSSCAFSVEAFTCVDATGSQASKFWDLERDFQFNFMIGSGVKLKFVPNIILCNPLIPSIPLHMTSWG